MEKEFKKNAKFNSKSVSLKELEERKEMLVVWDGKTWFPGCRHAAV